MEIPDAAIWAAAGTVGVTFVGAVKVSWAFVTRQLETRDAKIKAQESRVKGLEESLVKKTEECAEERIKAREAMTQIYVSRVDEGAELARGILQANNAHMSEFTGAVDHLTAQVSQLIREWGQGEKRS